MTATAAVHVEREGTSCVVTLAGEIDLAVSPEIIELGLAMIETADASDVLVDMGQVTFLDSTGIGALVTIRNAATARGLPVRVAHAPLRVRRILGIAGMDALLGVVGDDCSR